MNPTNNEIKEAFSQIHNMITNTGEIILLPNGGVLFSETALLWLEENGLEPDDLILYLKPENKNDIH
jgi:hypothetical protein